MRVKRNHKCKVLRKGTELHRMMISMVAMVNQYMFYYYFDI